MRQGRIRSSRAGQPRARRSCGRKFTPSGPEEFHHQDVVVVAAAVLQRVDLVAVLDEARLGIEPARRLVLRYDRELKVLDMTGCVRHGSLDETLADAVPPGFTAYIHAPDHGLV